MVNRVFGEPGVLIDSKFERRAILFDIGDAPGLPTRKLLCLCGPQRFIAQLEHKLAACTWNVVQNYETDFLITAHELGADGQVQREKIS
jgi:ribonuclease Z